MTWIAVLKGLVVLACMAAGSACMERAVSRVLPQGRKPLQRIAPYALFFVVIEMPSWVGDENPLYLLPFFLAVICCCYEGTRLSRLVAALLFYILVIPVNMMVDTLWYWGMAFKGDDAVGIFLKAAVYLALWLLIRRLIPAGGAIQLPQRLWGTVGALCLAPLFGTLSYSIWNMRWRWTLSFDYDELTKPLAYTVLPFVFLSALALLYALTVFSRQERLEQEHQLANLREIYYQGVRQEQAQVRILRHDLRNHLTVVQGLMDQGDYEKVRGYLDQMAQSPALQGSRRICANETANVVLSSKRAVMESEGMEADFSVSLPEALSIPDPELCALLGNALDNAIEAVRKAEDKRITVRARADKGMLMLRVENPVGGTLKERKGCFETTKSDKSVHGFGITGMREIAERRGGTLDTLVRNGRFELIACVPLTGD
ncbi:GHKL domain-containing protein [Oscillibacter hominis]|uniref:GHKL domain-containing protein n=1 Tax=Oscillibacter hominis TaxID=2763056 RepID=A0A7G9B6J3_9FIRM|nr:GHKL domain-containing protein [Oscillibacter hominis]QNL45174.1 GHKL domain-containing protein [Oscillibacter hominis]